MKMWITTLIFKKEFDLEFLILVASVQRSLKVHGKYSFLISKQY